MKEINLGETSRNVRKVAEIDLNQKVNDAEPMQKVYRMKDMAGAFSGTEETCGWAYPGILFGGGRKDDECAFVPVVGDDGWPEECYAEDAGKIPRLTMEALVEFLKYSMSAKQPGGYKPDAPKGLNAPSDADAPNGLSASRDASSPKGPGMLTADQVDELRRLIREARMAVDDMRYGGQTPEDAYYEVTMCLDKGLRILKIEN